MEPKENTISPTLIIALGVAILIGAYYYYYGFGGSSHTPNKTVGAECDIKIEKYTQDNQDKEMENLIKPGQVVDVEMGFYGCNEPQNNDIVLLQTSGRPDPIIRIVKVVPNDKFEVEKNKDKYNLFINGDEMQNLDGSPYQFHEAKSLMLKLYEKNLQSKMIANTYFVFSNDIAGGYDSTRFGPIEKSKILGRIVMHK